MNDSRETHAKVPLVPNLAVLAASLRFGSGGRSVTACAAESRKMPSDLGFWPDSRLARDSEYRPISDYDGTVVTTS